MEESGFRIDPTVALHYARLRAFLRDERGQAATEYVLIVGLICLAIALAFKEIQLPLKKMLERIVNTMTGPGI